MKRNTNTISRLDEHEEGKEWGWELGLGPWRYLRWVILMILEEIFWWLMKLIKRKLLEIVCIPANWRGDKTNNKEVYSCLFSQVEMSYSGHLGAPIAEDWNPLKRTVSCSGSSGKADRGGSESWAWNVPAFNIYDLLKYKRQRLVKAIEAVTMAPISMVTKEDQSVGFVNSKAFLIYPLFQNQNCLGKCIIEILDLRKYF